MEKSTSQTVLAQIKRYHDFVDQLSKNPSDKDLILLDKAYGCLMGAFLGDAIGGVLEMIKEPTEVQINEAFNLLGGGHFNISPGQITDDSEMALNQAFAFLKDPETLNLDELARHYAIWYLTNPFSVGRTVKSALMVFDGQTPEELENSKDIKGISLKVLSSARKHNIESVSNGGLMRIQPICIWSHKLSEKDTLLAAGLELSLTHPRHVIHEAGGYYSLAVGHLLHNPGDASGAYKKVEKLIKAQGSEEIKGWWKTVENDEICSQTDELPAWGKTGWTLAFQAIKRNESDYIKMVKGVLAVGWDTDTNASIAGGLLGATLGISKLPREIIEKVISVDVTKMKEQRPEKFQPSGFVDLVPQLLKIAPSKLTVVPSLEEINKSNCLCPMCPSSK